MNGIGGEGSVMPAEHPNKISGITEDGMIRREERRDIKENHLQRDSKSDGQADNEWAATWLASSFHLAGGEWHIERASPSTVHTLPFRF